MPNILNEGTSRMLLDYNLLGSTTGLTKSGTYHYAKPKFVLFLITVYKRPNYRIPKRKQEWLCPWTQYRAAYSEAQLDLVLEQY